MKIQLKRSLVIEGGAAKKPTADQMDFGEIAINYGAADPSIFIKDSGNKIVKVGGLSFGSIPENSGGPNQPGTLDDRYVQLTGAKMTGNLEVGNNITLTADTGAIEASSIDSDAYRIDNLNDFSSVTIANTDTFVMNRGATSYKVTAKKLADDLLEANEPGEDGKGWTGGSYDSGTGIVTFTSDDGLGFSTTDLRGADGLGFTGGSYNSSTGKVTFTSDDGLGFETDDLRAGGGNEPLFIDGSNAMTDTLVGRGKSNGNCFSFGDGLNTGFRYDDYTTNDGNVLEGIRTRVNNTEVVFYNENEVAFYGGNDADGGVKIKSDGTINSLKDGYGVQFYGPGVGDKPMKIGFFRQGESDYTGLSFYGENDSNNNASESIVCKIFSDGDIENRDNQYGGLSDAKYKTNITFAASQWDDIKALSIRSYDFTPAGGKKHIGVVAQEVELTSPGLVINRTDEDTGETYKSVAYSVLYVKAVKALQEAMERIEVLEAKVAELSES